MRIGNALDTLKKLAQEEAVFDLVFLDADKRVIRVIFNFSLITIWSSGGIFLVDNTLLQGEPYLKKEYRGQGGEAIKVFNEYVSKAQVEQVLILFGMA